MQEKKNLSQNKEEFPAIPLIVLVLFLVAAYVSYRRAYVTEDVYYFMSEQEVEEFDPLMLIRYHD